MRLHATANNKRARLWRRRSSSLCKKRQDEAHEARPLLQRLITSREHVITYLGQMCERWTWPRKRSLGAVRRHSSQYILTSVIYKTKKHFRRQNMTVRLWSDSWKKPKWLSLCRAVHKSSHLRTPTLTHRWRRSCHVSSRSKFRFQCLTQNHISRDQTGNHVTTAWSQCP